MRILFVPNFPVKYLVQDDSSIPSPNKLVKNEKYWFFKYMPDTTIDIIDSPGWQQAIMPSGRTPIGVIQALRAMVEQKHYDLVLAHSFNSAFLLAMIRSILGVRSPPMIVVDVGCLNGGIAEPCQIGVLRFALKNVDGIIYHSSSNEAFYSHHFPGMRRAFVPFGTDPDFFSPLERNPSNEYALSIGYAKRDYGTLVKAWEQIDTPLTIVGDTSVNTHGAANIRLRPKVSISMLRELIHDAAFIVLPFAPCRYSIGQMTLTQCMAMGKPVVVTRIPGLLDYIRDGVNCLAVRPCSPLDIVQKVRAIEENTEVTRSISVNARKSVVESFNERNMATAIRDFISAVIE